MDALKKKHQINYLKNVFNNIESIIVINIDKLTADDINYLRRKLYKKSVLLKVIKNTLARIAIKNSKVSILKNSFVGSTAISWSNDNIISAAKIFIDFKKNKKHINIKSGISYGKIIGLNEIKYLAELPNINTVRINIFKLIYSAVYQLFFNINKPMYDIINIIKERNK